MRLNYIANALSIMMIYTGIVILSPIIIALIYHDYTSIVPFISAGIISMLIGYLLRKIVPSTANLENLNSVFINDGLKQSERLFRLNKIAISQMQILNETDIKYLSNK